MVPVDNRDYASPQSRADLQQCPALRAGSAPLPARPDGPLPHPPFVVISKFVIANDMTLQVKQAFRDRPHQVDDADGFLRMEVLSPVDEPQEIWLITYWREKACFETWHHSHLYQKSHAGIPKGLKLVPKKTEIRYFEGVST